MYKHGNLSKNDIKLFPFLLYRILEKKNILEDQTDDELREEDESNEGWRTNV